MLRQLIDPLHQPGQDRLLVGIETADDAGVYKISEDLALVQTTDFFTPIVDDPYTFGQIAAANALSDVYAMGGTPLTALNISAFPQNFPLYALQQILKGGHDKIQEAGATLVGGHTVQDKELKYGLAVTGTIHPKKIITNQGAKPDDALILTKPLGTGILTTAIKKKKISKETIENVCYWMAHLNKSAADCMAEFTVHACTDITGFGLAGHCFQLSKASGVGLHFDTKYLPHYPDALYFAKRGLLTGADQTNRAYTKEAVEYQRNFSKAWKALFYDAQTSGGLLICLPQDQAYPLLRKLHAAGLKESQIIGYAFSADQPKLRFN